MHAAYFETRFKTAELVATWPESFAIITAYATTGEHWSPAENADADAQLEQALRLRNVGCLRLTGYSPTTGHEEPGWACEIPFDDACDLGALFRQDAIYVVSGGALSVTYCDERRCRVPVGVFVERLDR
jgi:hypothetical protein